MSPKKKDQKTKKRNKQPLYGKDLTSSHLYDSLETLPRDPGIYRMLDSEGVVIYVGKAKNLHKRVLSYFNRLHEDAKTHVLVTKICHIETTVTRSEHEALILERQLIKEFKPRYNILLKDDKSFPYIKVTVQEPFPRLMVVREKLQDGAAYFGPYTSVGSIRSIERLLYSLFPIRDCTLAIDLVKKQRKCIQLDLGNCIGPCVNKATKEQYDRYIDQLILFLKGKNKVLLAELYKEMEALSAQLSFEKAAQIRDRIRRIEALQVRQGVELSTEETLHLWHAVETEKFYYALVQRVIDGKLLYTQGFYEERENWGTLAEFLEASVAQFYGELPESPDAVLCEEVFVGVVKSVLWELELESVSVMAPKRGEKADALALVKRNAAIAIKRIVKTYMTHSDTLESQVLLDQVQVALKLSKVPVWILGFDISHFQGSHIVASAVSFRNGWPEKATYRKFQIRSDIPHSDDPACIFEVVSRRLGLCQKEGTPYPDLLLIDGGLGQLHAAMAAVSEQGLSSQIEIVALAKQFEELWRPEAKVSIRLPKRDPVLQLFQRVRDEAHRFANTYQRTKRREDYVSLLEAIPNLGPKRIALLYRRFGTLEKILEQSQETLQELLHVSPEIAEKIVSGLQRIGKVQ